MSRRRAVDLAEERSAEPVPDSGWLALDYYPAVMSFRDEPTMVADVWRGGRLETVRGQYPRYRYGPVP